MSDSNGKNELHLIHYSFRIHLFNVVLLIKYGLDKTTSYPKRLCLDSGSFQLHIDKYSILSDSGETYQKNIE